MTGDCDDDIDTDEIPTLRYRGYQAAERCVQICAWLVQGEALTEDIIATRLAIHPLTVHKLVASVGLAFPVYEDKRGRLRLMPREMRSPSS